MGNGFAQLSEDGKAYIVEAELPGVKKEDVEIRVENGGKSITIEGKVFNRRGYSNVQEQPKATEDSTPESSNKEESAVVSAPSDAQTFERSYSKFSRTVWLPQPVDAHNPNIKAQLVDGILTVTAPKVERDTTSVKVAISD